MTGAIAAIDSALSESDRLRNVLKKAATQKQVRSSDERGLAKATALTWFNTHRPQVAVLVADSDISPIDQKFTILLEASERHATRSNYLACLKEAKNLLISLRSKCVPLLAVTKHYSADNPPNFSPLISDVQMQGILIGRWNECVQCLRADAPLAATVMMGGLLEGLLLARINRESNKGPIFTSSAAPKEKNGATKPLNE